MIGWIETPYAIGDGTTGALFRQQVEVISYDLPIETAQAVDGIVTIKGGIRDVSYCVLTLENFPQYAFKITSQSNCTDGITKLGIADSASVCDGILLTEPASGTSLSGYFAGFWATMRNNAELIPRSTFAAGRYTPKQQFCSSIELYDVTSTQKGKRIADESVRNILSQITFASIKTDIYADDADVPEASKLIRFIRSIGVICNVTLRQMEITNVLKGGTACLSFNGIYDAVNPTHIVFNDGHSKLITESYEDDVCSCVYIIYPKPTTGTNAERFTLTMNGEVVSGTDAENQLIGYFKPVKKSGTYSHSAALNAANAIFANNTSSHKIEFCSDKEYHIGQPVRLSLDRGLLDTAISKVSVKSGDNRFYYTCGELPVTATDNIKAAGWTYGTRRPTNPPKGTLFISP